MRKRCAGAASSAAPYDSPVPEQPADVIRAFTTVGSRSAIQLLTREEVTLLLMELGLPYSPAWSVDELKQILKENMFPQAETAVQRQMKGVHLMKKAQLLEKAEEVGADTMPGMTSPLLKLAIRRAIIQKSVPVSNDTMGFGEYGPMTYQQVLSQHPSYAARCRTESGPESSWQLARFVSWLNEQEAVPAEQEMTRDPTRVPPEPLRARGGAGSSCRQTGNTTLEDETEDQEKEKAAAQEEKGADQLVSRKWMRAALNQINQRLERLEARQSSAGSDGRSSIQVDPSQGGQDALG